MADPYIAGLIVGLTFLWLIPLGIWLMFVIFIGYSIYALASNPQQRREWKQRSSTRALAIIFILSINLMAGFIPPSLPQGEAVWGAPISEGSDEAPPWPASEQYIWVLSDGTIIVETHMQTPGVLNPWFSSWGVNELSQVSGAKEDRFMEAVSLMDDWAGPNSFSLSPIHGGVTHDYQEQTLLFTHDDIMLDLFGMHSSGEMITIWSPQWGGDLHLLTVIKMGSDPFIGNPGAQSYAVAWLNA